MGDGLPPLREVVRENGLMAKKGLGQNFLFDLNLTGRIARSAGKLENRVVIEVGPGPGGLTRALLMEGAKKVVAIERDERCRPILARIEAAYPGRVEAIFGDALTIDPATLTGGDDAVIVANLPYNVATPLLVAWLRTEPWPPWFQSLTLMFQREVAERIVAGPGSKAYGRLSVLAGWRTEAHILFDVPASAFVPPPKITSSVVQLIPRPAPLPCDADLLEQVVAAAFGQRRKMLRASLKGLGAIQPLLEKAGLEETLRAEDVSVEGFVALTNAFAERRNGAG